MYKTGFIFLLLFTLSTAALQSQNNLSNEEKALIGKAVKYEKNGWTYLHIEGSPAERGFQHGYLMAKEISELLRIEKFVCRWNTGQEYKFFVENSLRLFGDKIEKEYYEEMKGIALGAEKAGADISYEDILFWNASIDVTGYWYPWYKSNYKKPDKTGGCSAFIASGKATGGNGIVMGHNTWASYYHATSNLILNIKPDSGSEILMQAAPGLIHSGTDFFISKSGIIGVETTITGFKGFDTSGIPEFTRMRKVMQYAKSLDECNSIMIEKNNGGYANTWLFGNVNTGEIERLELGLDNHKIDKKFDGYFTGSNITEDISILRSETDDDNNDIRNDNIARKVRWKQLFDKFYGNVNIETGEKMLGDHYDVYMKKENPDSRTICGHGELDPLVVPNKYSKPFYPSGAFDAKIVDSKLAKEMKFWAKWGSACEIPFDAKKFLSENPQYDYLEGYIHDRKRQPWTLFDNK